MTQEYKSIREWIAEGVNPVGYVSRTGMPLVRCDIRDAGLVAFFNCGGEEQESDLEHHVAPPKPKRLSDEELLAALIVNAVTHGVTHIESGDEAEKLIDLRSQILDRMKAKGPTRREVATALKIFLSRKHSADMPGSWSPPGWEEKARDDFLSMFPEGEE